MKVAVTTAATAGAMAACAATGVGVAAMPLCGVAGAMIVGIVEDVGEALGNLFGKKKKAPILIDAGGNVAARPFSDLYRPTGQTHMAMLTQLAEAVASLRKMHDDAGLTDPYDDNVVLQHLHDVHGLTMITDGDPTYAVAVPDLSRAQVGPNPPLKNMIWNNDNGWHLQPPDITRDYQHINQEAGSSWVQKGNEAKFLIAMGLAWIDQLHVAAGREATIIAARASAHQVLENVGHDSSKLSASSPNLVHVSSNRPGVSSGVTFLRIMA
jgi:hypothetical protein